LDDDQKALLQIAKLSLIYNLVQLFTAFGKIKKLNWLMPSRQFAAPLNYSCGLSRALSRASIFFQAGWMAIPPFYTAGTMLKGSK